MHRARLGAAVLFLIAAVDISYAASSSVSSTDASYKNAEEENVVHDEASGTPVRSMSGACVGTEAGYPSDGCAPPVAARPVVDNALVLHFAREERTIYSGFNQASLSPETKEKLDTLAALFASQENVTGVRIIGYADYIGNPGYNEKLSKRRAENVRDYLVSKGLVKARVADTRWLDARVPTTDCPDTLNKAELIDCLRQDRRVEVEVDYKPDAEASR